MACLPSWGLGNPPEEGGREGKTIRVSELPGLKGRPGLWGQEEMGVKVGGSECLSQNGMWG